MADRRGLRLALRRPWACAAGLLRPIQAGDEGRAAPISRPFRIEVVDDETGRGVPLVELRTVNQIRYVTDSNGIVAFDEPGLLGKKVFFHVKSHGYEYPKDGFGNRGVALETQAGRLGPDQDQAAQHRPTALPGHRGGHLSRQPPDRRIRPDRRAGAQRPGARAGQRGQRGLRRQDPLVLGRHQSARAIRSAISTCPARPRSCPARAGSTRSRAST